MSLAPHIPDPFNSVAHAKSFLTKRGLMTGMYMQTYVLLKGPTNDHDERVALRYLKNNRIHATYDKSVIYSPDP